MTYCLVECEMRRKLERWIHEEHQSGMIMTKV